jgi:pectate lyase
MKRRLLVPVFLGLGALPAQAQAALPAFPQAEGYGALSKGGRGGRVIEVTTLADSGPGSLRAALAASGPRTVVFRVGGTLELLSDLVVSGESQAYLTIAGQTAPGGGILLKNYGLWIMDTHDVVVRFLRIRVGYQGAAGGQHGVLLYGYRSEVRNVILDHVSVAWGLDDNTAWGNVKDVSIQWSLFGEAAAKGRDGRYDCSNLTKGQGGCGALWNETVSRLSFHHNLLVHNYYRNPALAGGPHQLVNNVVYNHGWSAVHMGQYGSAYPIVADFVGNYFAPGPDSRTSIKEIRFEEIRDAGRISLYVRDNHGWSSDASDPFAVVDPGSYVRRDAPASPAPPVPVSVHDATQARVLVLQSAGASLPVRDAVDIRLIGDFHAGTASVPGTRGVNAAFPHLASGRAPSDTDHDGMPDTWETMHGLNPADAADGAADQDGDGYTNLEEYLSLLAGDVAAPAACR